MPYLYAVRACRCRCGREPEARPARTVAVADGASRTHRKLNHCGVHDQSSTLS